MAWNLGTWEQPERKRVKNSRHFLNHYLRRRLCLGIYRRGLKENKLLLIVTDGSPDLAAAIRTAYPRTGCADTSSADG